MPVSCCLTQFLPVRQGALPRCHGSYAPAGTTVLSVCRSVIPKNNGAAASC